MPAPSRSDRSLTMADHWMALEVLRELEEAGARYFAIALLSPASLQHLVSLCGS